MRIFTLLSVLVLASCVLAQSSDNGTVSPPVSVSGEPYSGPVWNGPKYLLFDNGPIITSYGTGVGGADESIIDPLETTNGFGCQWLDDIRLTDDFTVPAGATWEINSITLIGYQTGYGPPSTITGCFIEIFDNEPEIGSSVWGDLFSNVMTTTAWMNVYRVNQAGSGTNTDRPVMASVCEFGSPISLGEGTYWICFQQDGSEDSGPWCPPITINGQLETGNAIQYYAAAWNRIEDSISGEYKGLPFILEGESTDLQNDTWAGIKSIF
jgi:hypothetical protein